MLIKTVDGGAGRGSTEQEATPVASFKSSFLGSVRGSHYLAFLYSGMEGALQPSKIQRYRCSVDVFTAIIL